MRRQTQQVCDLYISHSAPTLDGLKWFVVTSSGSDTVDDQITSLLESGRTVYHIMAKPCLTKRLMQKSPITLKPIRPRRRRNEQGSQDPAP